MSYLGSKGASGTMQMIINHIPAHETYIEPFVGSGVIVLNKEPAFWTVINDLDERQMQLVADQIYQQYSGGVAYGYSFDAVDLMKEIEHDSDIVDRKISARNYYQRTNTFIYCDPPYLHSTRTSNSRYKFEMNDDDHIQLCAYLVSCDAMVMLSGYPNDLYDELLPDWNSIEFRAMTRGGVRTEKLWMNYDINEHDLHQTNFLGKDFGDRQRIKRKVCRLSNKINNLPRHEKQAIVERLWST